MGSSKTKYLLKKGEKGFYTTQNGVFLGWYDGAYLYTAGGSVSLTEIYCTLWALGQSSHSHIVRPCHKTKHKEKTPLKSFSTSSSILSVTHFCHLNFGSNCQYLKLPGKTQNMRQKHIFFCSLTCFESRRNYNFSTQKKSLLTDIGALIKNPGFCTYYIDFIDKESIPSESVLFI